MDKTEMIGILIDDDLNIVDTYYDGVDDGIIVVTDSEKLWKRLTDEEQ